MSAARRPGGSWISQNYDKLTLIIVLIALLASALFLVMQIADRKKALAEASWEKVSGPVNNAAPTDMAGYAQSLTSMTNPPQMPAQVRLMVSEIRVSCVACNRSIAYDAKECPFSDCGAKQPDEGDRVKFDGDGDGIPDVDEEKMQLNPQDPTDAKTDNDGDQFNNLEEYNAKTDMNNASNYPPPGVKLRLVQVKVDLFKYRFLGISRLGAGTNEANLRYQLNLRTLERTHFVKLGETVDGFKVTSYEPTAKEGPTLVLVKGDTTIRLVKDKIITSDSKTAFLVCLLDQSQYKVQIDNVIKVKDHPYKVVDITEARVLIRDERAGQEIPVTRMTEDDKLRVGSETGVVSPAGGPGLVPMRREMPMR